MAGTASQTLGFTQAFTLFNTRTPQIYADIDRTKSELLGVPINRVFETLSCIWARPSSSPVRLTLYTGQCPGAILRQLRGHLGTSAS
jgi:multidrug efflux pump subunit AcrB